MVVGDNRCFKFDNVFATDSSQEEVYRKTTLPLVKRCLDGFNATVLAYGQTGSGKTWTVGNAYVVIDRLGFTYPTSAEGTIILTTLGPIEFVWVFQ